MRHIITVNDEVITTTAEHPFWIVGKGWVKASNLEIGEHLVTNEDVESTIQKVEVKKEHRTVYNFRVKEDHTYCPKPRTRTCTDCRNGQEHVPITD